MFKQVNIYTFNFSKFKIFVVVLNLHESFDLSLYLRVEKNRQKNIFVKIHK